MGLIKSNAQPSSVVPFSMRDVEDHARALIGKARSQAEQLLAAAQTEAEALKETARLEGSALGKKEGFAAGVEAGRKSGHAEALASQSDSLKKVVAALTTAVTALEVQRAELSSAALSEVVKLSVLIARKITRRQAQIDPQVLCENLEQAMSLVSHATDIRIAVRPEQRQVLTDTLPALQLQWPNLKHIEVVDDPSLQPGGCRIYMQHGFVDTDLDAQLDRIVTDLLPGMAEPVA